MQPGIYWTQGVNESMGHFEKIKIWFVDPPLTQTLCAGPHPPRSRGFHGFMGACAGHHDTSAPCATARRQGARGHGHQRHGCSAPGGARVPAQHVNPLGQGSIACPGIPREKGTQRVHWGPWHQKSLFTRARPPLKDDFEKALIFWFFQNEPLEPKGPIVTTWRQ